MKTKIFNTIIHRTVRLLLVSLCVWAAFPGIVSGQVTPGNITPATQTIASGSSATLTHSGGTGITSRQWQVSTNNGNTWTSYPGATAATWNTGNLWNTGTSDIIYKLRVQINGQAVYSAEAVITVMGSGEGVTTGSITGYTYRIEVCDPS